MSADVAHCIKAIPPEHVDHADHTVLYVAVNTVNLHMIYIDVHMCSAGCRKCC